VVHAEKRNSRQGVEKGIRGFTLHPSSLRCTVCRLHFLGFARFICHRLAGIPRQASLSTPCRTEPNGVHGTETIGSIGVPGQIYLNRPLKNAICFHADGVSFISSFFTSLPVIRLLNGMLNALSHRRKPISRLPSRLGGMGEGSHGNPTAGALCSRPLKNAICFVGLHPSSLRRTACTPHSSGFARLASHRFAPALPTIVFINGLVGIPSVWVFQRKVVGCGFPDSRFQRM